MARLKLGREQFRNRNRALPGNPIHQCRVKQGSRDGRCCRLEAKQPVVDCRRIRGPIEHICKADDGGAHFGRLKTGKVGNVLPDLSERLNVSIPLDDQIEFVKRSDAS